MAVRAFIDESGRDQRYDLCVALVEPTRLTKVHQQLDGLLLPDERQPRFAQESQSRRSTLADAMAALPVAIRTYQTTRRSNTDELARQSCLEATVRELAKAGECLVDINSRDERDRHDEMTIRGVFNGRPAASKFFYDHVDSRYGSPCWIADAAAWCFAAGGDWRERIMPIIAHVIELENARP